MPWSDDWDWEDEDYREMMEERRYWLDWADGVLNQDPEPGEAPGSWRPRRTSPWIRISPMRSWRPLP